MKTVEWLKSELLGNVAYLHRIFVDSEENSRRILKIPSNIILESYILAQRLGISFKDLDYALRRILD